MAIQLKPTKIKQSVYLLIPHDIVDITNIKNKTTFTLTIKTHGKKKVLEYSFS